MKSYRLFVESDSFRNFSFDKISYYLISVVKSYEDETLLKISMKSQNANVHCVVLLCRENVYQ